MIVKRRTFEAKQWPKGSTERATLNGDPLTSEYFPSMRYIIRQDDGSRGPAIGMFRTKAEAEAIVDLAVSALRVDGVV